MFRLWLMLYTVDVCCKYNFFFPSSRQHTKFAFVTVVQTCALPISLVRRLVSVSRDTGTAVADAAKTDRTKSGWPADRLPSRPSPRPSPQRSPTAVPVVETVALTLYPSPVDVIDVGVEAQLVDRKSTRLNSSH